MYFFKDKERVAGLCKAAVEQGIVLEAKHSILEANGIEWGMDSMSAKDVSVLEGKCVMAMLMGAVRAERFRDGALLGFLRKAASKNGWSG